MHLTETFHETVGTILALQDAQIEQGLGHLLDEQWHALSFFHQSGLQSCGKLRHSEDMTRHRQRLGLGEAVERQCGRKAAAPERRRVADAIGHQEEQRYASHRVQQRGEALFTASVDPVQVFDHQHQGTQPCATERQHS
jgi:hypothetical protein